LRSEILSSTSLNAGAINDVPGFIGTGSSSDRVLALTFCHVLYDENPHELWG
jgi:hypothetical protein